MTILRQLYVTALIGLSASLVQAETLLEIYEHALDNDPELNAAEAAYLAGKESQNIARAALLPNISASASYTEAENNIDSVRVLSGNTSFTSRGDASTDTESAVVSLSQPLFNLPAWHQFQQGKQLSEQARLTFSAKKQQEIIDVASAYFAVLRSAENLNSANAEEKSLSQQLEQTQQRYEVGLLPITDVHEAQAAYDNALANSLEMQGSLNIAFEGLEVLTGIRYEELSGLAGNFPTVLPEPLDVSEWVGMAQNNNLTLKAQYAEMEAALANARARRADHLPTLTGSASYYNNNADGVSLSNPTSDDNEGSEVKVSLSMPIFAGGLISANRRQAEQRAIQAEQSYEAAKRNITQQTRSNHLRAITNVSRVKARKQAVTSAQSAFEATQAGYDVGTRNIVDVLNAQRVLFQAQRDYANTRYDYIESLLSLKQVSGYLSPEDLRQLNEWLDADIKIARVETL